MFPADVGRMTRMLSRGGGGRRCENWRVKPLQPGWSLNREQGDREQQAEPKSLHSEGCERSPPASGRLVPCVFKCAEHCILRNGVSSGTGPSSVQTPGACDLIPRVMDAVDVPPAGGGTPGAPLKKKKDRVETRS